MSGIKAKISETVNKLTHHGGGSHGTAANTTGTSGYDNTSSGYSSGKTGNLDTTGTTGTGYNTTSGTTGMGTTGTGMGHHTHGTGMGATTGEGYTSSGVTTNTTGTGQIIDSETFTKTEDHERLVEKKRYELEHHPVQKQYVVETKYVGEKEVAGAPTEVVGSDSQVVDERIKQAPAGDRTVVVENVDVPGSELRTATGMGMGQTTGTGMGTTGTGMGTTGTGMGTTGTGMGGNTY